MKFKPGDIVTINTTFMGPKVAIILGKYTIISNYYYVRVLDMEDLDLAYAEERLTLKHLTQLEKIIYNLEIPE